MPHSSESEAKDLFPSKSSLDAKGFLKVSPAKRGALHLPTSDNGKYTEESVSKQHTLS
jgi:hypothetical protein